MDDAAAKLRRFLSSISRAQLGVLLPLVGFSADLLNVKLKVDLVAAVAAEPWTADMVAFCDLCRLQNDPAKWSALRLTDPAQHFSADDKLWEAFHAKLDVFMPHHMFVHQFGEQLWVRICPVTPGRPHNLPLDDAKYVVYRPHAPYLLTARVSAADRPCFLHALKQTFAASDIEQLALHGSDVLALLDLTINQFSQGQYQAFRLGAEDGNPLALAGLPGALPDPGHGRAAMVDEGAAQREQRHAAALQVYGSLPPAIPKLEYSVATLFRGERFDVSEPLAFNVTFKGSNVFDGLKRLCHTGLADKALPAHMERAIGSAKSEFHVTEDDF